MMTVLRLGRRPVEFSARGTLVVVSSAVVTLGVWIISPRFTIGGPSLVDDWSAVTQSPQQLGNLAELLNPSGARFRPGWILWNYVQWHTFDAPTGVIGPNLFGLARLALFVLGLTVATVLLVGIPRSGRVRPEQVVLVALPPLAVLTAPWMALDFARFGPQEPVLVGGMLLGGALLYLGARDIARESDSRVAVTGAKIAAGYPLWTLGVYQKEVSVCALVLLPCLALTGRRKAIVEVRRLGRKRRLLLAGLGVAVLLPLAHVAFEVGRIVHRGNLIYGAPAQPRGVRHTVTAIEHIPSVLGTPVGLLLLAVAVLGAAASLKWRGPDWIQIGLLLTAIAALSWSAQTDVLVSRYYIPTIALLAIGSARAVRMLPPPARHVATAILLLAALASVATAHHKVRGWASDDRRGVQLVSAVAGLEKTGCRIATTGLDPERTLSLPALVALRHHVRGHCGSRRAFLVSGTAEVPDERIVAACSRPHVIGKYDMGWWGAVVTVNRCDALAPTAPTVATTSAPSTSQTRIGYCLHGVFFNLSEGQQQQDPSFKGAVAANFIAGKGITCLTPPPGFVRRGFATADMGVPAGIYPYYAP